MVQSVPELAKYFVTVTQGGGSGAAAISAIRRSIGIADPAWQFSRGQRSRDLSHSQWAGNSIQRFRRVLNLGLTTNGCSWLTPGTLVGVFPTRANTSTNVKLSMAPGSLVSPKCMYGVFNGLPGVTMSIAGVPQSVSMGPMRSWQYQSWPRNYPGNFHAPFFHRLSLDPGCPHRWYCQATASRFPITARSSRMERRRLF